MSKIFTVSGRRKKALSRATIKSGKGKITVNNIPLDVYQPEMMRLKLTEPLILAGNISTQVDIRISVNGGGVSSRTEAVRLVIAKSLMEYTKDEKLKKRFLEYDRHLLVADVRKKETCKPNDSKARAKRQKSYR